MKCTKCGRELPENAAFCPGCGERVAAGEQKPAADKPVYLAEIKGLLKSGRLAVYRDRVEFSASSAQKTVYNYDSLVAVKKRTLPTPAILFITEDGQTGACAVPSKNIHEAFFHIEQAVAPYLEERKARLLAQGVRYSLVSGMGMGSSGILDLTDDRAEFLGKSGKKETVLFRDVRSASLSPVGALELLRHDGEVRSFALEKEVRDEVVAFVRQALGPYLAQRKKDLLARGIYYSFCSCMDQQERGNLEIYADRAEFTGRSGQTCSVPFREVRAFGLYAETLAFHLADGTSRSFTADGEEQNEIAAFVGAAVEPHIRKRTEGFDRCFGSAERLEINPGRGVFHILRQNGAVITEERPLEALVQCRLTESAELNLMISGIRMGGKAIASKAAEMTGRQGGAQEGQVRSVDLLLTLRDGETLGQESVRLGDFPLGLSRTSPKYVQCAAEAAGLMDYLREACPDCELVMPAPPEPEAAEETEPAALPGAGQQRAEPAGAASLPPKTAPLPAGEADPFGIRKYISGIARYIGTCQTPRAIAFQGNPAGGSGLRLLAAILEERYGENLIWFHSRQLSRSDLGEKLPMFIGASLIGQLGGAGDGRAVKFAKASINLAVTVLSQGNSDGSLLIDALFKDAPKDSLEDLIKAFSEQVKKRTGGEKDKVIVILDDLDSLAPAKAVEILEAAEDFFGCDKCVFVVAIDHETVVSGFDDLYGKGQNKGDAFFDKIFRSSFRLPATDLQVEATIKNKLEQMGLAGLDPSEAGLYRGLAERSTGSGTESLGRLFDSFQMLQTLADEELYQSSRKRMILFGLLCMQRRFRAVYDQLVRMKGSVTPELLSGLCDPGSEAVARSGLAEGEEADFREFARLFCDVINADSAGGISRAECGMFVQVLEFSGIALR